AAFASLVGKVWVCDLGPGHDTQVGLALFQDALGYGRVVDSAGGDHRYADHGLDGGRQGAIESDGERHIGYGPRLAAVGFRRGADDVEIIKQTKLIEPAGDLLADGPIQATVDEIVAGHADADDEVAANPLPNGPKNLDAEAQAVGEVAAVGIGTA